MTDPFTVTRYVLEAPHSFLQPSNELHSISRLAAKKFLDPLAFGLSHAQNSSERTNKLKRKRPNIGNQNGDNKLQLQRLYVDGFDVGQIWQQAIRIIDAAGDQIRHDLLALPNSLGANVPFEDQFNRGDDVKISKQLHESHVADDASPDSSYEADGGTESHLEISESEHDSIEDENGSEATDNADVTIGNADSSSEEDTTETYIEDQFGLNDGFFSIDGFNKQSEYFERLDANGIDGDHETSDGEEIDWHTDPTALSEQRITSHEMAQLRARDQDQGNAISDDEGPIFDESGINVDSSDEEMADAAIGADASWIDTNDIKYADFFAPPPKKASTKKARSLPKTQPSHIDIEGDLERAMADVRRDLFEEDGFDANSDSDPLEISTKPQADISSHEKQRARITNEIRRLEAANVAKKEWMLAGEARAIQRPSNSLIENDLDFERIGKPVPVITHQISEELEQLVKRRILAKEFDEIRRRLPGSLKGSEVRAGRIEIDDTKPQQSLADLYEIDHRRANDPTFVDLKDERLRREHSDIGRLWKDISSQLDSLSNWHYKPKIPQANINVVTDAATITIEEARPTGQGVRAEQGTLAPQEIYNPVEREGFGGEVVLKSGASIAKDEMSREERSRRRRKQKEQSKRISTPFDQRKNKEGSKTQLMTDLKKGGVTIVGERGELESLGGKKLDASQGSHTDQLKL
jgi:U3 small nucleolar RNA-associated protein MPP10